LVLSIRNGFIPPNLRNGLVMHHLIYSLCSKKACHFFKFIQDYKKYIYLWYEISNIRFIMRSIFINIPIASKILIFFSINLVKIEKAWFKTNLKRKEYTTFHNQVPRDQADRIGLDNAFSTCTSIIFCRMWSGADITRMRIYSDVGYGAESDRSQSGCGLI
jgi:hypothetical protein